MELTFERLLAIRYEQFRPNKLYRCPRLKELAAFINAQFPVFEATVTADGIAGTRTGNVLTVRTRIPLITHSREGTLWFSTGEVMLRHNAAEAYRTNYEVVRWILANQNLSSNAAAHARPSLSAL